MEELGGAGSEYLVAAEREHAPYISYEYEDKTDPYEITKIIKKSFPENRFQKIKYYRKGDNFVGNKFYSFKKNHLHG
ncbi:MAG: hypothetical protein H0W50_05910 [Parachlamydiaceae bacterium]|nr:hypothetical protein [Parachlamydiaceae bacterium]